MLTINIKAINPGVKSRLIKSPATGLDFFSSENAVRHFAEQQTYLYTVLSSFKQERWSLPWME